MVGSDKKRKGMGVKRKKKWKIDGKKERKKIVFP